MQNIKEILYSEDNYYCNLVKKEMNECFPPGFNPGKRPARVSQLAHVLDNLFCGTSLNNLETMIRTNMNILYNPDLKFIYMEYEYMGNKFEVMCEHNQLCYAGAAPDGVGLLYPLFAYQVATNEDLKKIIEEGIEQYKTHQHVDPFVGARIFHYFNEEIKSNECYENFSVYETDISLDTIKQQFQNGMIEQLDILQDFDCPDCKFVVSTLSIDNVKNIVSKMDKKEVEETISNIKNDLEELKLMGGLAIGQNTRFIVEQQDSMGSSVSEIPMNGIIHKLAKAQCKIIDPLGLAPKIINPDKIVEHTKEGIKNIIDESELNEEQKKLANIILNSNMFVSDDLER